MKKISFLFFLLAIISVIGFSTLAINRWRTAQYTPKRISTEILTPRLTPTTPPSSTTYKNTEQHTLPSRSWLSVAETLVKDKKISPPEAARLYAYVSTVYYEILRTTQDQELANAATKSIMLRMYPANTIDTYIEKVFGEYFNPNAYQYLYTNPTSPSLNLTTSTLSFLPSANRNALEWLEKIFIRERTDGFYNSSTVRIPNNSWRPLEPLQTPHAGSWQRWLMASTTDFAVPSPPASGSAAYQEESKKLASTTNNRTSEQEQAIQLWLGEKNQITLSGQWQDILWEAFQKTKLDADQSPDLTFAHRQKILAQSLADTYSIVWQIKFTYWRASPAMTIPNLKILAPTHSPSYVSEDAAVAATAQIILSTWYPERAHEFEKHAVTIRDATIQSGKQFELDANAGFALGKKIGVAVEASTQK